MKSSMALAVITILAAVFSVVFAGISAYYARQANRTTGFLEISARYGVKDVYDISQMPEENTIIPGKLFNAPPPIIRQDHGLHIDIRNTGRYQEQVVKIGFTLENHERIEFQSPDPQGIRRMPPEIKHRLPFTVSVGGVTTILLGVQYPGIRTIRANDRSMVRDSPRNRVHQDQKMTDTLMPSKRTWPLPGSAHGLTTNGCRGSK